MSYPYEKDLGRIQTFVRAIDPREVDRLKESDPDLIDPESPLDPCVVDLITSGAWELLSRLKETTATQVTRALGRKHPSTSASYLSMARNLQGGAELIGRTAENTLLLRDAGPEPVRFGFNEDGERVEIYDGKGIDTLARLATFDEVKQAVKFGPGGVPTGYQLPSLNATEPWKKPPVVRAYEVLRARPFVGNVGKLLASLGWEGGTFDRVKNEERRFMWVDGDSFRDNTGTVGMGLEFSVNSPDDLKGRDYLYTTRMISMGANRSNPIKGAVRLLEVPLD